MAVNAQVLGELAFVMLVGPCGLDEAQQVHSLMRGHTPADTVAGVVDQVRTAIIEVRSS